MHEACRLLYVAATRAREELHFFARPCYKSATGAPAELIEPRESLLRTAWPAWKDEIQRRFDDWRASASLAQPATIGSIAASDSDSGSASSNLFEFESIATSPLCFTVFRTDFSDAFTRPFYTWRLTRLLSGAGGSMSATRGPALPRARQSRSCAAPAVGSAARSETRDAALAALARQQPRIAATIRAAGIDSANAARMAAQAVEIVRRAAKDPVAQWILSRHTDAANEIRWTGVVAGSLRTVQVDRVFRAGPAPQTAATPNEETWWIIDYKTAHQENLDPAVLLPDLRGQFAPQIEAYAAVLRNLRGANINLCGGLYYPRMVLFDWWQLNSPGSTRI